jgi:hypothetical protein
VSGTSREARGSLYDRFVERLRQERPEVGRLYKLNPVYP